MHSVTASPSDYFHIDDLKGTIAEQKIPIFPVVDETIVLDLSDCPRKFEGDSFRFTYTSGTAVGEFFSVTLFGWEEEK